MASRTIPHACMCKAAWDLSAVRKGQVFQYPNAHSHWGHRARAAADNGMGDGLHGRHARPLRAVCAPVLTYTALAVLCIAVLEVAHVIGRLYRFRADRDRWMRHNGDLAGLPMGCRSAGQAAEHSRGGRWSRVRSPRRSAHFTRDQRRARGMPGASHEAGD